MHQLVQLKILSWWGELDNSLIFQHSPSCGGSHRPQTWNKSEQQLFYLIALTRIQTWDLWLWYHIELHAATNSTQKLKLMGRGRQFTYIPTVALGPSSLHFDFASPSTCHRLHWCPILLLLTGVCKLVGMDRALASEEMKSWWTNIDEKANTMLQDVEEASPSMFKCCLNSSCRRSSCHACASWWRWCRSLSMVASDVEPCVLLPSTSADAFIRSGACQRQGYPRSRGVTSSSVNYRC